MPMIPVEAIQEWLAHGGAPDYIDPEPEVSHVPPHPRHMCGVDVLEAGVCDYCGQPTGGEHD